METKHDEEGNKQGSIDKPLGVIIQSETHSRSSSSSSSSSAHASPPKHLPESSLLNGPEISQTDSPPVQVMVKDNNNGVEGINYDPNRIPSSVFERSESNIPAEWSCASNESLFSIHLGRNSFTVDLMKSGELLSYSPSLPMPPPPGGESNPVIESKFVDTETSSEKKEEKRQSHEKEQHPAVSWKTPTSSYRSNRSSNSAHSFSFPILAGAANESASGETEEEKKQEKQSQHTQQPAEVAKQKQSMCRWFSCFPPCPWCCSSCSCS